MRNLAVWSQPSATVAAACADVLDAEEGDAKAGEVEVLVISKREESRSCIVESCSPGHLTLHHL